MRKENTYSNLDISSVLTSRESSSVGFTDGGDGDDFGAVDQGVRVVAKNCHFGHDGFEFAYHGALVGCYEVQENVRWMLVRREGENLLAKDCHSHAVRESRARV